MKRICEICPRHCKLDDGQAGFCGARVNRGGTIACGNYARVSALALDPIEKKPLARFHPGSKILSVGSYGCNLSCPFCQNHEISMAREDDVTFRTILPDELVALAEKYKPQGNIGVAFTYNEPLIGYEYVRDCAALARQKKLCTVLVTNGMICETPWLKLLPSIDAANIDLKGFSDACYRTVGGDFETVKRTISLAAERIHVEVTTLVVPGLNDDADMMRQQAKWLAGLKSDITLHVTRFFPMYHMRECQPTRVDVIDELVRVAQEYLPNVYRGNC